MTPIYELRRRQGVLHVAGRLLSIAALLQLPLIVVIASRLLHFDWTIPNKAYWILNATTSVLAIVGFTMACRQLNLYEEAMENSSLPELARNIKLLGSGKIVVSVQLFFYLSFLVPLMNLPAILWGRAKANAAAKGLDAILNAKQNSSRRLSPSHCTHLAVPFRAPRT